MFHSIARGFGRIGIVAAASFAAGCAASPADIPASYVSPVNYQNWTCDQLAQEGQRLVTALTQASQRQEQARTNDTVGVLLVGLPVGSMSGQNIAPEVGRLKGEHEALYHVALEKRCDVTETDSINR